MNNGRHLSGRGKGYFAETIAAEFLKKNGYEIIQQNYYYRRGEIDIVAKEGDTLVFVEVKSRKNTGFGLPEESVTPKKQELIRRTAEGYVLEYQIQNTDCRFDVVSVVMHSQTPECVLLKDCF